MQNDALKLELIDAANALADAARIETLKFFRSQKLETSNKDADGYDPVTLADKNAEEVMREILSSLRPEDSVIGEEFGKRTGNSEITWVLDPIDGTRAYICGTTSWGVLISVEKNGHPIFGIIDQPYIEERYLGGFDKAQLISRTGSRNLSVRNCADVKSAVLLSTFPEVGTIQERTMFEKVASKVQLTRYGLDCYGYALLAMGQVDLVIEAGLNRYDISAPIAVVEAAGGIVTNWQGEKISDGGQVIAAGDERTHAEAIKLLNS